MTSYRILATLWLDWTPHATDRLVWRPNGFGAQPRAAREATRQVKTDKRRSSVCSAC